jgi:dTDP-4-amino-4,6-dideoxygalactose transaminase
VTDWRVPLADPVFDDEDIAAVVQTYRSGWLSAGPRTAALEEAFAAYVGAEHAVAVANGTAALHLGCVAARLGPGDEVITPSLTFVATVNAIAYTGAAPVFADIAGPTEPWLSAAAAERAITDRTAAIMSVAYGGHPGDVEALRALCAERDLVLLEDTAHAVGARLHGRHLGTFGLVGAFSFFSNKNLAIGEGGMAVTSSDEAAESMRLLRSHGMTTSTWDRHRSDAAEYDVLALGFNYRIDEPRAALAMRRLARLDEDNRRRATIAAHLREALLSVAGVTPAMPPAHGAACAHHLFTIVLDPGVDRDRFRSELAAQGVQTSVHYRPVHRLSAYSRATPALPLTESYGARTVTLPLFPHMSDEQRDLVIDAVEAAARIAQA